MEEEKEWTFLACGRSTYWLKPSIPVHTYLSQQTREKMKGSCRTEQNRTGSKPSYFPTTKQKNQKDNLFRPSYFCGREESRVVYSHLSLSIFSFVAFFTFWSKQIGSKASHFFVWMILYPVSIPPFMTFGCGLIDGKPT